MARMTSSQIRSRMQQLQSRQRQALTRYNQAVRDYNRKVGQAIDNYNREVRAHNARVRANRQRVAEALARLQSRPQIVTTYVTFRASVDTLHHSYVALDREADSRQTGALENELLDLSERENAKAAADDQDPSRRRHHLPEPHIRVTGVRSRFARSRRA